MEEIKRFIRDGISKGYYQNLLLKKTDNDLQFSITEYVFTVNVAQQLLEWRNTDEGKNHLIHIEYDSNAFKQNAFLPLVWVEDPTVDITGRRMIRRGNHTSIRNGRIDIAVMRRKLHGEAGLSLRSVSGIEIKGINPNIDLVILDIVRLIDALLAEDKTSNNNIQECYVTFCIRLDTPAEIFDGPNFNDKSNAYKEWLGNIINVSIGDYPVGVSVELWEVLKITAAEYTAGMPNDELDAADVAENTGAVVGVLIKMKRK